MGKFRLEELATDIKKNWFLLVPAVLLAVAIMSAVPNLSWPASEPTQEQLVEQAAGEYVMGHVPNAQSYKVLPPFLDTERTSYGAHSANCTILITLKDGNPASRQLYLDRDLRTWKVIREVDPQAD